MRTKTAKDLTCECWLCGRNGCGDPLDAHHIFGGANRKLSDRYGLVVPLCHKRCHESGPDAVHRNAETAQRLHEWGQEKAMREQGWSMYRCCKNPDGTPYGWGKVLDYIGIEWESAIGADFPEQMELEGM